jgi:hypothetical protein
MKKDDMIDRALDYMLCIACGQCKGATNQLTAFTAERDDAEIREQRMWRQLEDARTELAEVTAERDRLLLQMDNLRSRIRSDAYAMSFQTMGQYRTALLNAFPRPCSICRREDCTTEHACE